MHGTTSPSVLGGEGGGGTAAGSGAEVAVVAAVKTASADDTPVGGVAGRREAEAASSEANCERERLMLAMAVRP